MWLNRFAWTPKNEENSPRYCHGILFEQKKKTNTYILYTIYDRLNCILVCERRVCVGWCQIIYFVNLMLRTYGGGLKKVHFQRTRIHNVNRKHRSAHSLYSCVSELTIYLCDGLIYLYIVWTFGVADMILVLYFMLALANAHKIYRFWKLDTEMKVLCGGVSAHEHNFALEMILITKTEINDFRCGKLKATCVSPSQSQSVGRFLFILIISIFFFLHSFNISFGRFVE